MNKETFLDLLRLQSRCGYNEAIHEYIKNELTKLGVQFSIFDKTTIYNISTPNVPLLAAHTDTVRSEKDDKHAAKNVTEVINEVKNDGLHYIVNTGGVLGGDDMCGIHIILELLRNKVPINFLFCDNEETVVNASSKDFTKKFSAELSLLPYCLVLDRKGDGDIICEMNYYGSQLFEDALLEVGEKFGYMPELGMCSDADYLRNVISCANLSVGYYKAHSAREFVIWEHMENTYNYIIAILGELHTKYPTHPAILTTYFQNSITENILSIFEQSGVLNYR